MQTCAYCDRPCSPTREHIVPNWYEQTPGESETFSARAPLTHRRGDLVVKDVCRDCNNGPLAALDAYGKELYERYFVNPAYAGEAVGLDLDGGRLVRWLLKLSYNSGRAQNADTRILRGFRAAVLGRAAVPDRVRCWVHLVPAAHFTPQTGHRAARRVEAGGDGVHEPAWFRICQMRVPRFNPATGLVQRQVLVNSFAFSLIAAPLDGDRPDPEFEPLAAAFAAVFPEATPLPPTAGRATARTGRYTATSSLAELFLSHPGRFAGRTDPYAEALLTRQVSALGVHIPRESIEAGDDWPVEFLHRMVANPEQAAGYRQRIELSVGGYDDDPRELWEVPEAREYLIRLFLACPFVFLLVHPAGRTLRLLMACWLHGTEHDGDGRARRVEEFFNWAFVGLNEVMYRLAISEEVNREVCAAALQCVFGAVPEASS